MLEGKAEIISTECDGSTYARIALELHFWSGIWQTYRNPRHSASVCVGTTLLHMRGRGRGVGSLIDDSPVFFILFRI
jgi:hypothetical protein